MTDLAPARSEDPASANLQRRVATRVLVCGGRNFAARWAVARELDRCLERASHLVVIQGGASGADQLAREWCARSLVPCENFPADWRRHGRAAGPLRNARMLAEGKPDLVIAFPGGRGTADMVRKARAAGVPIRTMAGRPSAALSENPANLPDFGWEASAHG